MILEAVINVCFVILGGFSSLFPNISWSVDSAVFNAFFDIIRVAGYLLPMHTVVSICSGSVASAVWSIKGSMPCGTLLPLPLLQTVSRPSMSVSCSGMQTYRPP